MTIIPEIETVGEVCHRGSDIFLSQKYHLPGKGCQGLNWMGGPSTVSTGNRCQKEDEGRNMKDAIDAWMIFFGLFVLVMASAMLMSL